MVATNGSNRPTAAQKLRAMLDDPKKLIVCPGVYDGYTARIALAENVDCLYMVR
jgi:2-methylisocitrate lyase-like PEP mutase family enzyme